MKCEIFNMTRGWDKEKNLSFRQEWNPWPSKTGRALYHKTTRTRGEARRGHLTSWYVTDAVYTARISTVKVSSDKNNHYLYSLTTSHSDFNSAFVTYEPCLLTFLELALQEFSAHWIECPPGVREVMGSIPVWVSIHLAHLITELKKSIVLILLSLPTMTSRVLILAVYIAWSVFEKR